MLFWQSQCRSSVLSNGRLTGVLNDYQFAVHVRIRHPLRMVRHHCHHQKNPPPDLPEGPEEESDLPEILEEFLDQLQTTGSIPCEKHGMDSFV